MQANYRQVLGVAALIIVAGTGPAASAPGVPGDGRSASPRVRAGGVYALVVASDKDAQGVPLCVAVRLYEDGTAIEVEFRGKPADLAGWFDRNKPDLFPGTWALAGDQLTVVVSSGFSEGRRTGTLGPDGWQVETVVYAFAPVAFARAQDAPGGNRRPFFVGHGKSAMKFDYDRAGTLRGINHELEVEAVDPDGDALEYTWKASNGTVEPQGPKVVWKRPLDAGRPVPGEIRIEVSDGKGGKVSSAELLK